MARAFLFILILAVNAGFYLVIGSSNADSDLAYSIFAVDAPFRFEMVIFLSVPIALLGGAVLVMVKYSYFLTIPIATTVAVASYSVGFGALAPWLMPISIGLEHLVFGALGVVLAHRTFYPVLHPPQVRGS